MKPFVGFSKKQIIAEDELFWVVKDSCPVSLGHTLIVVKRIAERFRELTAEEKLRLLYWIDWCVDHLQGELDADGFNIGLNDGPAAGQTVAQLHVHVIPRYVGDVPDPRGGVRFVVPHKAKYWSD